MRRASARLFPRSSATSPAGGTGEGVTGARTPTPQPREGLAAPPGRLPAPTGRLSASALGDFSITAAVFISPLPWEDLLGDLGWQGIGASAPLHDGAIAGSPAVAYAAVPLELEPSGSPSRRRPSARERRMGPSTSRRRRRRRIVASSQVGGDKPRTAVPVISTDSLNETQSDAAASGRRGLGLTSDRQM